MSRKEETNLPSKRIQNSLHRFSALKKAGGKKRKWDLWIKTSFDKCKSSNTTYCITKWSIKVMIIFIEKRIP